MAIGLIGKKLGMTKVYTDKGEAIAVTVVDVSSNALLQVKTKSGKDGYSAIQLGYEDQKESRVTKPLLGHFKKFGVSPKRIIKEFRVSSDDQLPAADAKIDASLFSNGQWVDVIGTSKGKGFQGVVKR
jgi:large subunit ribosomal protein L3